MPEDLENILKRKYPAKEHAKKVTDWIKSHGGHGDGIIYLEGQKTRMIEVRYSGDGDTHCLQDA